MRVWVWSNDHSSAHVHVAAADWQIAVLIGDEIRVRDVIDGDPKGKDIERALKLVAANLEACREEWRRNHG